MHEVVELHNRWSQQTQRVQNFQAKGHEPDDGLGTVHCANCGLVMRSDGSDAPCPGFKLMRSE